MIAVRLVASARLGKALARRRADGSRARPAACAVGRAQLAHASRSAFLAPRYSELPGEFGRSDSTTGPARGSGAFGDVYPAHGKLTTKRFRSTTCPLPRSIRRRSVPASERLLDKYNNTLTLTGHQDGDLRRNRPRAHRAHPLRTYARIPVLRSLALWFTPRVELLPFSGHLGRFARSGRTTAADFRHARLRRRERRLPRAGADRCVVARDAAAGGFWLRSSSCELYFHREIAVETPEPRYVLECFPAIIALGAQAFRGKRSAFLDRLGVNREAENLRKLLLHAVFEIGSRTS